MRFFLLAVASGFTAGSWSAGPVLSRRSSPAPLVRFDRKFRNTVESTLTHPQAQRLNSEVSELRVHKLVMNVHTTHLGLHAVGVEAKRSLNISPDTAETRGAQGGAEPPPVPRSDAANGRGRAALRGCGCVAGAPQGAAPARPRWDATLPRGARYYVCSNSKLERIFF